MSKNEQKRKSAQLAADWLERSSGNSLLLGIGTGSTVNHFIDLIEPLKSRIDSIVSSSASSTELLRAKGLEVSDPNSLVNLDFYVDGADEINKRGEMIKGGGGAQTGEKILASLADCFICVADDSKVVTNLGSFPIAIEVIANARSYVSREIVKRFGAQPELRHDFLTDQGNPVIDVYNLDLTRASQLEDQINCIVGVVENGIFARNRADLAFIAGTSGVEGMRFEQ